MKPLFFTVTAVVVWAAMVAFNANANMVLKRGHDKLTALHKRNEPRRNPPVNAPGYYDSSNCPFEPKHLNCVEVAQPVMWRDKSQGTDCAPGGYTCRFPIGGTASAQCPDGSTGVAHLNDPNRNHGDSWIEYKGPGNEISGTFLMTKENSEVNVTHGTLVSAYLECVVR